MPTSIVDQQYQQVEELFYSAFPDTDGSQISIIVGGKPVLQASVGLENDDLVHIYSCSKALCAIAFAHLVDQGRVDLEKPVSFYWREFAAKGKEKVTVRQVLSHQAGLPETAAGITSEELLDGRKAAAKLANERPFWAPGSAFGYHALTIGTIIDELFVRITGGTVQEYFEKNVRLPSGADAFLGLPDEFHNRVFAPLPQNPPSADFLEKYGPPKNFTPGPYGAHIFRGLAPTSVPDPFSLTSPLGIRIGQPAAGGVASAHGLATVFQWAVGYGSSKPAINPETLADFAQLQVNGYDLVLDAPQVSFGTIFMKPTGSKPFGSPLAFGHDGAAGAMIYADPLGEIILGYTVRRFTFPGGIDQRLRPIIQAIQSIALS